MKRYNPNEIEPKWQKIWADSRRYQAQDISKKPKYYVSGMFPYPSGAGMHTGHFLEHSIVDTIARFRRALGYNVMYPMGWDSFGLPAENYAIKTGRKPSDTTRENIASFKNQLTRVGASIDWSREINTADPDYYKWTQWIFTKLFEQGLAYQKEANQWWCPKDKTVLANEQVINGRCWRCEELVVKKPMKQWFFKITDYADDLLAEIPNLDWPTKIKVAQTNWIGRSEGVEVDFKVDNTNHKINVFTTRPDTIFGATFLVLAPEHPLIDTLVTDLTKMAVKSYVNDAIKKSEVERQTEDKDKTGIFTGSYAINPASGEQIPIWVADYVLGGYGTGAVMAVPGHDERDFAFATKFNLPIKQVVAEHHVAFDDFDMPKDDKETLNRPTIDAIITDGEGNYLLESENDQHVHFVGGGVDDQDESDEVAIRREVLEEVGYPNIISIKAVTPYKSVLSYRHTKDKNQKTWGRAYEVVVDTSVQVESEIEAGRHKILWVAKKDVASKITWRGHQYFWDKYLCSHDAPEVVTGEGTLVNSGSFSGSSSSEAREQIVEWLTKTGNGKPQVTYKIRDWLISRQRYWGAPIPIIHCPKDGVVPVPQKDLPVLLPNIDNFEPRGDGKSVLASDEDWVNTTCPKCGGPAKRETDTMDGYACSSWYLLRFTDPQNIRQAWAKELADYWVPLDMYIGGDHAVAHLLYVRFWSHVFYKLGLVPTKEPVKQLVYHGLIQAEDGRKMSKSLGNVVDPLEVIDAGYGADTLRMYELFLGPINENSQWSSRGIAGVYRFTNRLWTVVYEYIDSDKTNAQAPAGLNSLIHSTIKKVTNDINRLSFNTAIATLMECVNELYKLKLAGFTTGWQDNLSALVQLVQPFAPHISAELWQALGNGDDIDTAEWPRYDDNKIKSDTMLIIVQINGKLKAKLDLPADFTKEQIQNAVLKESQAKDWLNNKKPAKVIYVPGKLVNLVV